MTVWRELRRIRALPANAPEHLQRAHRAAKKQIQRDGDETATVAWDEYFRAQGGSTKGRNAPIKLATRPAETLGRYGDSGQPRPVGVETVGPLSSAADPGHSHDQLARLWLVESERHKWTIERAPNRRMDWRNFSAAQANPAQPWTRVNNCTNADAAARLSTFNPPESASAAGRYAPRVLITGHPVAPSQPCSILKSFSACDKRRTK